MVDRSVGSRRMSWLRKLTELVMGSDEPERPEGRSMQYTIYSNHDGAVHFRIVTNDVWINSHMTPDDAHMLAARFNMIADYVEQDREDQLPEIPKDW